VKQNKKSKRREISPEMLKKQAALNEALTRQALANLQTVADEAKAEKANKAEKAS
jgi:hypothetical protein